MNSYEAKQAARKDRLYAASDRAAEQSNAAYKRADLREEASGIPLGQPILVGHHSEGRHRAAIKRADNAMRASIEADKRAKSLADRADAVGAGGISSDDPDAIDKLRDQLAKAQVVQDYMREANKIIRKATAAAMTPDSARFPAFAAALKAIPGGEKVSSATAADMLKPDFAGRIGFASYQLTNNGANIKRIEQRIAHLERNATRETVETSYQGFCRVVENAEENRLQMFFEGKPADDVRAALKGHGFRWAPSEGAWQRQLSNGAKWAASRVLAIMGAV